MAGKITTDDAIRAQAERDAADLRASGCELLANSIDALLSALSAARTRTTELELDAEFWCGEAARIAGERNAARREARDAIVAALTKCEAASDMPRTWHEAVRWALKVISEVDLRALASASPDQEDEQK